MAIEPRLARGPRLSQIPMPVRERSVERGLGDVVDALGDRDQMNRQADRQVEQIEHQIAVRDQRDAENLAIANAGARMAELQTRLGDRIAQMRTQPDVGVEGHRDAVKAAIDAEATSFWESLGSSPRVREAFIVPMAQLSASLQGKESAWVREQSVKAQGDGVQQLVNVGAQAILNDPRNAGLFAAQVAASDAVIESLDATPEARLAARRIRDQSFRAATIDGLEQAGDFASMRRLVETPEFMGVFDGDYAKRVLDRADRGERSATIALEAAQRTAEEDARNRLDAIGEMIDQGGIVPQADINAAVAAARAAKVPEAQIIELQGKGLSQAINREFGSAADPNGALGRAELARLNGVARDRALTSDENMRYQRLLQIQGQRRASDAALLRANLQKEPRSYLSVLGEIDKRPAADRFATAEEVRPGLGYFALLQGRSRSDAIEGYFDLQANPDMIKAKRPGSTALHDPTPSEFRKHLGAMAAELPEETIERYGKVAASLYAHYLKDAGASGWNPTLFARAANVATGAKFRDGVWRGGIGQVNGRNVWLPDWASAASMETLFARADYSSAVYANGQAVDRADVLNNFTPVLVEGGGAGENAHYVFVNGAGQVLKRKDGGDFRQVAMPRGR